MPAIPRPKVAQPIQIVGENIPIARRQAIVVHNVLQPAYRFVEFVWVSGALKVI